MTTIPSFQLFGNCLSHHGYLNIGDTPVPAALVLPTDVDPAQENRFTGPTGVLRSVPPEAAGTRVAQKVQSGHSLYSLVRIKYLKHALAQVVMYLIAKVPRSEHKVFCLCMYQQRAQVTRGIDVVCLLERKKIKH